MRWAVLVAAALFAGCFTPAASERPAASLNNATAQPFVEDYKLRNESVPKAELQNATLGESHIHDLWGSADQLTLLDGNVDAGLCEGAQDAAAYAILTAAGHQEAAVGCARLYLPEGTVVPEGSQELTLDIDATGSLKSGSLELQWRDKAREATGEVTTQPKHTWSVALTSADWDLPHAKATTFVIYVASRGPAGAFDGPVHARIVAHKLAGWKPVLAIAHVDHWKLPHLHDFAAPGVMRLYDGPANVTNIDPARFTGGNAPKPIALHDIIAPGAQHITLIVDRKSTDCAPALECWLVPALMVGGYERERFGKLIAAEGERRVYQWDVPDPVPADSVYANASTTMIDARIDGCVKGGGDGSCGLVGLASTSVTSRILVLVWEGEVDKDLAKSIAGPSALL